MNLNVKDNDPLTLLVLAILILIACYRIKTKVPFLSLLARALLVIARVFTSCALGLDYAISHFRTSQYALDNEKLLPKPAEDAQEPVEAHSPPQLAQQPVAW